ncbi:hypothetical protein ACOSP7_007492 [Xanthoceras sorbifolium]
MDRGTSTDDDGSIRFQVFELRRMSEAGGSGTTIFEPQSSIEKRDSTSNADSESPTIAAVHLGNCCPSWWFCHHFGQNRFLDHHCHFVE